MFEIGDSLREARIRKGLSMKDVADGTKIRSKYLQALEEEDFEIIPGSTFVKGFMRTYAEYLDLDADLFMEEYRSRFESAEDPHRIRPLEQRSRPRAGGPTRSKPNLVIVAIIALVVIFVLVWAGWGRGGEPAELDPATVGDDTTTSVTSPETEATGTAPDAQAAQAGAASQSTISTAAASTTDTASTPEGGEMAVVATASGGRCWLLVRDGGSDGEILYSGTLEEGQQESFSADGPLWMQVGSPASLDLTVNGAPMTVPEPYGEFKVTSEGVERVS